MLRRITMYSDSTAQRLADDIELLEDYMAVVERHIVGLIRRLDELRWRLRECHTAKSCRSSNVVNFTVEARADPK
jgi:hypothetical protein